MTTIEPLRKVARALRYNRVATPMAETKTLVTAETLERMPRDPLARYELAQGELVPMTPVGGEHGAIAARFASKLLGHAEPRRMGHVMVEAGYRLTRDPDTVRAPDISFLAAGRVPPGGLPKGFIPGPPDLAVEVISPEDVASEVEAKVQEYLTHGVRLVLIVHPRTRTVTAYHGDGTARVVRPGEAIDGGSVVPGFTLSVDELFAS